MNAKSRRMALDPAEILADLFDATARSFELEALRISKQLLPGGSRAPNKRANHR
ncbi:hypothetical protein [Pseudomonas mandelii]|uniref:hypothetical protein n=1 Tax=Pseudomonas mandelii TaxID=75612 RepID=UPI00224AAE7F|nr:hypothetical protein [Pseudomonas mandelii]MCX2898133.1 hypothetical protein [Pseudomonas mandelii]